MQLVASPKTNKNCERYGRHLLCNKDGYEISEEEISDNYDVVEDDICFRCGREGRFAPNCFVMQKTY